MYFVKGNKNEMVPKKCNEYGEIVDCREINQILLQSNCQTGEQTRSSNVFVCLSNAVRFVLGIISIYKDISPSQQLHIHCGLHITCK